ncbi:MAG TPA: CU044_5270 family protein, partial [Streptosporangiaceae bacterium]|nr:CU044_5270 family protein [Streptosporangiaceae bacterium]
RGRGPASASRGRRPRLALVGGLSLALAAGVTAVQLAGLGGSSPAHVDQVAAIHWAPASPVVQEVAYRTAAVAAAQPDVGPGQWMYWKEKVFGGKPDGIFQVWTTADSRRAAYVDYDGKVRFISPCYDGPSPNPAGCAHAQFLGQPAPFVSPHDTSISQMSGTALQVSYADLGELPDTPRALADHIAGLRFPHWAGWGPAPVRVFSIIEEMLTTYVMPPALTAELYQTLGILPGVTIDHHAVDVAGRPAIGLSMAMPRAFGGGFDEILIDPGTHQLAGDQLLTAARAGSASHVLSGTAILQSVAVSGPGQLP